MAGEEEDEQVIEDILDTIGDERARGVLASLGEGPKSAKEIGDHLELSLPTVYRRLELLQEHELVKAEQVVADDGTHYQRYECNFDSTVIRLRDDEYDVRIYRTDSLPDRFSTLWDELGGE